MNAQPDDSSPGATSGNLLPVTNGWQAPTVANFVSPHDLVAAFARRPRMALGCMGFAAAGRSPWPWVLSAAYWRRQGLGFSDRRPNSNRPVKSCGHGGPVDFSDDRRQRRPITPSTRRRNSTCQQRLRALADCASRGSSLPSLKNSSIQSRWLPSGFRSKFRGDFEIIGSQPSRTSTKATSGYS